MQTQRTISSFFIPSGTGIKRRAEDEEAGTGENANSTPSNTKRLAVNLSPEQRARIEANREEAQKKLLANKSPQFFGPSWKKALAAEFTKEYFQKVCVHWIDQSNCSNFKTYGNVVRWYKEWLWWVLNYLSIGYEFCERREITQDSLSSRYAKGTQKCWKSNQ